MPFSLSSKDRLTTHDLGRFAGPTLFDRIARTVCGPGCLPRKELYEAWEVARRVRRHFRGGRIVDMAAGHALLAHILLILDDSSPAAVAVDHTRPPSAAALRDAMVAGWPRLSGRVHFDEQPLESVDLHDTDVVVASHACGALTDVVLTRAAASGARVAVLPCCHDLRLNDAGPLAGWMDGALAIDAMRAVRLEQQGYRVWTQAIPAEITPKNRLLLGEHYENA
jgi:hypothetical protein